RHLYSFKSLAPEIDLDEAEKKEVRELVAAINRNDSCSSSSNCSTDLSGDSPLTAAVSRAIPHYRPPYS
ncbi:MAG: hypothetical protein SVS85_03380, partial [Candidatus Nanohaloarchaea archaeon]|nr:hypothetical protein [Candidatus Nanohaloarchaea archaeon]